jgi:hypothetical protein
MSGFGQSANVSNWRKTALLVDLANAHRLHLSGERVSASEFNREKVRKKSSLALR